MGRSHVEQSDQVVPASIMNSIVSALRFFLLRTLDRADLARKLFCMMRIRMLPVVLSPDEVARLVGATTCLKHQAVPSVAYGAGLHASDIAGLNQSCDDPVASYDDVFASAPHHIIAS